MAKATDKDRYPTLTEAGRLMLHRLREHPNAPIYRNQSGNRLTKEDLRKVVDFEREANSTLVGWQPGTYPGWLPAYLADCLENVPFYKHYGILPKDFKDIPTIDRGDLSRDITAFFPDTIAIDRIINFQTSGTTGHPLLLASHPVVAASYLAFHKKALRRFNIELQNGAGEVGVVLVGYQKQCFTYVSVTPTMNESGLAKINLHPDDWRSPEDRACYLDALNPEVYTGDPLSFAILAELPLKRRPRALLSTSMALLPGLKTRMESHFGCPVLDIYSMNEAGPIAVFDPDVGGHVLLQHTLYVEILDPLGRPVADGERGEVTLTGGFNFCLPLLRYRTGDYASFGRVNSEPVLFDLEGRPPVIFRTADGRWLNNIEITHALKSVSLPQFTLHQEADGGLQFRMLAHRSSEKTIRELLLATFGIQQRLEIEVVTEFPQKTVQYTTDLPLAKHLDD